MDDSNDPSRITQLLISVRGVNTFDVATEMLPMEAMKDTASEDVCGACKNRSQAVQMCWAQPTINATMYIKEFHKFVVY
jgi:hypothetical protein